MVVTALPEHGVAVGGGLYGFGFVDAIVRTTRHSDDDIRRGSCWRISNHFIGACSVGVIISIRTRAVVIVSIRTRAVVIVSIRTRAVVIVSIRTVIKEVYDRICWYYSV